MSRPSKLIATPGPVMVPDFVLDAMRKPVVHHRSQEFQVMFRKLHDLLQYFFQSSGRVVTMSGTGTQIVELSMNSVFGKGEKLLVQNCGKFSNRWVEAGKRLGFEVVEVKKEWGELVHPEEVAEQLEMNPGITGMVLTHVETSTGVQLDLEETVAQARAINPDLLVMVDTICSAGIVPLYFDEWGIDVAFAASQKSLLNPAGLVFVALSDRAQDRVRSGQGALHLGTYLRSLETGWYPYTAPTQNLYGIKASLELVLEKGLPFFWNQVHHLSREFKKVLPSINCDLFESGNSDALSVFQVSGQAPGKVKANLSDAFGIEVAGGQGHLAGKILRVSHFGWEGHENLNYLIESLREAIEMNYPTK